jgi:hypothetical protein
MQYNDLDKTASYKRFTNYAKAGKGFFIDIDGNRLGYSEGFVPACRQKQKRQKCCGAD